MVDFSRSYDVVVVGGGNAALCAAITAREAGASVLVLEAAPRAFRGGNSRHTRNLRVQHDAPAGVLAGAYPEAEYWDDLSRVTEGATDEALARLAIRASREAPAWAESHGVVFQPSLAGTLNLGRTNAFFLGGGKALLNAYYRAAAALGVDLLYHAEVSHIALDGDKAGEITLSYQGFPATARGRAVVVASGGFEANLAWLAESWGEAARNFRIRGTPYNQGRVLRDLLDQGVAQVGDPTQCHAVAIDARAPVFDGGICTRLDCVPFGVVVNRDARRFYDEGEDVWPKRYAIWGRKVAQQPGQIAWCLIDSQAKDLFMPSVFPPIEAATTGEMAGKLGLDTAALEATIAGFNAAARPGDFDATRLDGSHTEGLDPPKTHWARPLAVPPFFAWPLRPGITFTYLGVRVDAEARVHLADGRPCRNLFAAGEIMAGSVLGRGYLAGFGMTIGTAFGRIAGREAARYGRA